MTLQELLTLSKLKSVQLIAGAKGADVTVSGAVMLDNPKWLSGCVPVNFCSQPDMS